MADLGTHFAIDDTLTIPFQTRSSTGALADADAVPAYRIYEEGGTTAVTSGVGAKRDDANTTGYYEASVSLLAATGFEQGKSYTIYKTATIGGVAAGSLDTFAITGGAAQAFTAIAGWPTTAELTTRLTEAGITAPSTATMQAVINAGIQRFEAMTRFFPFLSTGSDETRRFTPPQSSFLKLKAGLITLTSLTTHVSPSSSGSALTVNEDFWLMPEDAAERGEPYRWIHFRSWQHGQPRSLVLVGKWGFGLTVPDEAWEAVMQLALAQVLRLSASEVSGGMSSWMENNVQESYAGGDPFSKQIAGYEAYARDVAMAFRRLML
jgi:hypothetical protein